MPNNISQIRKRSGEIVDFDLRKIANAIFKATESTGLPDMQLAQKLGDEVVEKLNKKFHSRSIPAVEEIQDIVEEILIENKQIKTAKAYILYRDQRARLREMKSMINSNELMEGYLKKSDWRVKENSNMSYSLQGLNNHIASAISSNYWLNEVYTSNIREAHKNGDLHLHDLQLLAPYCAGWDLRDLLIQGFGGVSGKVESKPAKHFRTALGQIINFFYTLQGEVAGAEAFANFDTYLAPFVRCDNLNYKEVKQSLQEFLFNINVPTRVGFQTPFTNITMDLKPGEAMGEEYAIIGGQVRKEKYKEFQPEMDMINLAFAELMMEGDAKGRVFTFPIPTYNITKDFDWDSPVAEKVFEMTAKYGIPYFSNFINSDIKPDDARSMCCRLRLDNRELRKRGGGLFAANPLTGSIGVVTLNLPRIGYLSKTKEEFFENLSNLMQIARESLEIKRT
ncbi:MAG: ribonucleoside triphosphate reductase, partial [bacterium]|nr:ribonucleoside triphosphate reductase [bacterium]